MYGQHSIDECLVVNYVQHGVSYGTDFQVFWRLAPAVTYIALSMCKYFTVE